MEHLSLHELVAATVDPAALPAVTAELARRIQAADEERVLAEAVARHSAELEQKLERSIRLVAHLERQMSSSDDDDAYLFDAPNVASMLNALMAKGRFVFDPYDLEERVRLMLHMPNSTGARLAAARLLCESGCVRKRHGLYEVMLMT